MREVSSPIYQCKGWFPHSLQRASQVSTFSLNSRKKQQLFMSNTLTVMESWIVRSWILDQTWDFQRISPSRCLLAIPSQSYFTNLLFTTLHWYPSLRGFSYGFSREFARFLLQRCDESRSMAMPPMLSISACQWAEVDRAKGRPLWNRHEKYYTKKENIYIYIYTDVSKNRGETPQIIHFKRVFHYKPSILGYHYFWKHPYILQSCRVILLPSARSEW